MKTALYSWILLFGCTAVLSAEIPMDLLEPPAEDKAVVYFFLPGNSPLIPSVSLFDQEEQLPIMLGGREYFRYECDPGPHVFSIGGRPASLVVETGQWIRSDLEAGGIYAAHISNVLSDLVIIPLNGRMESLVSMKKESEQWVSIRSLLESKPPKPPGKERKVRRYLSTIAGTERLHPTSGFRILDRLNPPWTERTAKAMPVDRLPDPVPGKSFVLFFAPEKNPEQSITVFDGERRLVPDLEGGSYYAYETTPGTKDFWVPELRASWTIYRLVKADLEAGKVYGIYVDESAGFAGARIFGLSGTMDHDLRLRKESEAWYEIESILDSPGEPLSLGEALTGKDLKDFQKRLKKKSKKRLSTVTALK